MSRKAFWIITVGAVILIPAAAIAYWMLPQQELIPDVTKASELVLHIREHQKTVYGIDFQVRGEIDGVAELVWIDETGEPYKVLKLSGSIDARFSGDWYADEIRLTYKPVQVAGGYLKLRYRFLPWYPTEQL